VIKTRANAQQEQGGKRFAASGRSDGDRNDERLDDGRSKSSAALAQRRSDEAKGGRS
jgi:hypothetical protein